MVEFPQTSVLPLWMPCKNFWSLSLLLFESCQACSFYKKARTSLHQSETTVVYQAVMQGENLNKGPWHEEEDKLLTTFVTILGERRWDYIARASGLKRSGKSCRLRWLNYLRPNIKHGHISTEEEQIIIQLHKQWGNKWSRIAQRLPGRTDNEIKNYWRTHLRRKVEAQDEENCHCGSDYAKQDFSFKKADFDGQRYEADDYHKPVEDTFGAGNTLFDTVAISTFSFTSSPYENRLKDWMTEVLNDDCKINHQEDCNRSIDSYDDLWGWSGSIWDMN